MLPVILKWITILLLIALGALFLAAGFGANISLIKYKGLEASGVPVGVVLVAAAVALAAFWKIEIKSETVTEEKKESGGGSSKTVTTVTSSTRAMRK